MEMTCTRCGLVVDHDTIVEAADVDKTTVEVIVRRLVRRGCRSVGSVFGETWQCNGPRPQLEGQLQLLSL